MISEIIEKGLMSKTDEAIPRFSIDIRGEYANGVHFRKFIIGEDNDAVKLSAYEFIVNLVQTGFARNE